MTSNKKTLYTTIALVLIALIATVSTIAYQNSTNRMENMQGMNNNSSSQKSMNHTMDNGSKMNGMNHGGMNMNMSEMVKDDKSFIQNMIPHHQEAVDTSKIILAKSSDTELKTFAQEVITAQEKEIGQMKLWYKQWFNTDYKDDGKYMLMMGDLSSLSGQELDKIYTKGMIEHHKGAIDMAKKIEGITQKQEIKKLSKDIITTQNMEVTKLNNWLMSKYNDHTMMGM